MFRPHRLNIKTTVPVQKDDLISFVRENILEKIINASVTIDDISNIHPGSGGNLINALTTLIPGSNNKYPYNPVSYWEACFTSPLYKMRSYENLESIGDSRLNALVKLDAIKKYPDMLPSEIDSYESYYADNEHNAMLVFRLRDKMNIDLLSKIKFDENVRQLTEPLQRAMAADLYEAIYGTLFLIGEQLQIGLGESLCQKWFDFVMNNCLPEGTIRNAGNSVTKLEQLFSALGFVKNNAPKFISKDITENGITIRIEGSWYLSKAIKNFILKRIRNGDSINDNVMNIVPYEDGRNATILSSSGKPAQAYIKARAKEDSARNALDYLESLGITPGWSNQTKTILDTFDMDKEILNKFEEKLKREGYVTFTISKNKKYTTVNYSTVQLYGKTESLVPSLLLTVISSKAVPLIKKMIITYYVNKDEHSTFIDERNQQF